MKVLNVIRTPENLKDKNSDSYLRAIQRRAAKEGVRVNIITEMPEEDKKNIEIRLNKFCINHPNTIIMEPCEFEFDRMQTLDKNLTAKAIFNLIENCKEGPEVETVAILNRSSLIGRPLHDMLLQADYTPFMLHSKTHEDYKEELLYLSDIIVSATGADMTEFFNRVYNENFNIIDVSDDYREDGILKLADQREVGKGTIDLLFQELEKVK